MKELRKRSTEPEEGELRAGGQAKGKGEGERIATKGDNRRNGNA